jgi:hypothetical protein
MGFEVKEEAALRLRQAGLSTSDVGGLSYTRLSDIMARGGPITHTRVLAAMIDELTPSELAQAPTLEGYDAAAAEVIEAAVWGGAGSAKAAEDFEQSSAASANAAAVVSLDEE